MVVIQLIMVCITRMILFQQAIIFMGLIQFSLKYTRITLLIRATNIFLVIMCLWIIHLVTGIWGVRKIFGRWCFTIPALVRWIAIMIFLRLTPTRSIREPLLKNKR